VRKAGLPPLFGRSCSPCTTAHLPYNLKLEVSTTTR
jgi:hypothetical protein